MKVVVTHSLIEFITFFCMMAETDGPKKVPSLAFLSFRVLANMVRKVHLDENEFQKLWKSRSTQYMFDQYCQQIRNKPTGETNYGPVEFWKAVLGEEVWESDEELWRSITRLSKKEGIYKTR